ncbi:MAG: homocysteine S-methyltransferase family protein [Deltaproteobacteria bacterium]|nr:homocysteine S-methyltransferase family protein [Deltaproteobacteria bacterium]
MDLRVGWALDGAVGTELARMGADAADPERWVLDEPARVVELHRGMLAAGATAIFTASFAAPRSEGGEDRVRAAVSLAREAGAAFVFAALGPGEGHARLASVAVDMGADAVVLETFVGPEALVRTTEEVVAAVGASVLVVAGFCPLHDAATPERAALPGRLGRAGASAVLVGCGDGRGSVAAVAKRWAGGPLPVLARPSAGLPGALRTPADFAALAADLKAAGVRAMGGCCGAGLDHVRAIVGVAG